MTGRPAKHPGFAFEAGIKIVSQRENGARGGPLTVATKRIHWWMIGRLEGGEPFLLSYADGGYTNWTCDAQLGSGLRKKILDGLRRDCREVDVPPAIVEVIDVCSEPAGNAMAVTEQAFLRFFNEVWRAKYLDDRDEDWVELSVPYAEKGDAAALGARWDPVRKKWLANQRKGDLSAFARWLPGAA